MSRPKVKGLYPHLVVEGAAKAIAFYRAAFGAELVSSMDAPDGDRILHAVLEIDGHRFFVADRPAPASPNGMLRAPREAQGTTVALALNVADADACFARALEAGAKEHMALTNAYWGARYAQVVDPFGHLWEINQDVEKRSEEEMRAALAAEAAQAGK